MPETFVIDGQIGGWQFSKQFVREMLKDVAKKPVIVNVSSLGGDVNHALDIHDQFATHGDVTVNFTGMNASSATLISLGAKHIRISENSFYLIHKPTVWIDVFDRMNEDDIDALIAALEKDKKEAATFTLHLANMYAKKTGKTVKDILALMKLETWLTAKEAKDEGFVDELYTPSKIENYLEDVARMTMIAASGYPVPGRKPAESHSDQVIDKMNDEKEEGFINRIIARIDKLFNHTNTIKPMKIQFNFLNKVLNVEKLESADDKGVYLNEAQLQAIENALKELEDARTAKTNAETAQTTAENALTDATNSLDVLHADVQTAEGITAKVEAVKTLLAAKPAKAAIGVKSEKDPTATEDSADWNTINNLPHNKEADQVL